MQVAILGPVEVTADGVPVAVTGSRVRSLLARLALGYGRAVGNAELIDAIWSDDPPADAANALQSLVSRLRRALGDSQAVVQVPGSYRLAVQPDDVDAHRFTQAAAAGRRALQTGQPEHAGQLLEPALALWRGPVLIDLDEAPPAADQLIELRLSAQEDHLAASIECGRAADVVADAEALASAHPLRERFTVLLMRALAETGRPSEGLAAYENRRRYLAEELGSDPSAELQQAHLLLLRSTTEPVAEPPRHRTNLSAQRTTFLGRTEEAKRIDGLLDAGRLVTIIGPGGAGKTRLAAVVAGDWLDRMDDGVWLVELAPVTDPAALPQAVLSSLGLRANRVIERSQDRDVLSSEERLLEQLAETECLLVIDNCEHLITAVADLADRLLAHCPSVRILATSREPIGIDGEALCQLPPLLLPPVTVTADEVLAWPSVQLFADRAAAVSADFEITDATVGDVVEIVRRLDGLPLAIELAAARLRVLPVHEIAVRLSDRFRLLTGGSRTAMPRHRTLRAVVEWSWDLLTPPEQRLAEQLAIFPSGATVESATAVCAGPELRPADIPDLLNALVEKSLLQVSEADGLRYRMLETIREYGTEQLDERGEIAGVRDAHARFFAALAIEADPWLRGADQVPWVRRLSVERDNVLAALRYLGDTGDAHTAVDMALALGFYWTLVGSHSEAGTWLRFALNVPDPEHTVSPARRALTTGLSTLNVLAMSWGEGDANDQVDDEIAQMDLARDELGRYSLEEEPMIALVRPMLTFFANDIEMTLALIGEALEVDDPWIRATMIMFRGNIYENEGDVAGMRVDTNRALELFHEIGDRWGLASTLASVAALATMAGDLDQAITAYRRAIAYLAELGAASDEAFIHMRIADLCLRRGDVEAARVEAQLVRISPINAGTRTQRLMADATDATIARQIGDVAAMRALRDGLDAQLAGFSSAHPMNGHMEAMAIGILAALEMDLDEVAAAGRRLQAGIGIALNTKDMPIVASVAAVTAAYAERVGRSADAAEILGASAALRGAADETDRDFIRLTGRLTEALGPDAFAARFGVGRALDRAAALDRMTSVLGWSSADQVRLR